MFYHIEGKKAFLKDSQRFILLLLFFISPAINSQAQQDTLIQNTHSLELQVFAEAGLNNEASEQIRPTYSFKRTLLIYSCHLPRNFNFFLAGDTYVKRDKKPFQVSPYLKRAYLEYNSPGLSVSAGLLVLEQFKYVRQIWQLRYVEKTFQNKFMYGENRNIGILLKHRVSSYFSYDFAFTTGYSTPISRYSAKYILMGGQTFDTDFCAFRLFSSISLSSDYEQTFSLFITKNLLKSAIGMEIAGKYSSARLLDENKYGFSVFWNHSFSQNIMCFGRYDMNRKSEGPETENIILAGIQYSFKKHFRGSIFYENENFETNFYKLAVFIHYM
jgi:hypothetical protein